MRYTKHKQVRRSNVRVRHHNHSTTDHINGKNGTLNEKASYRGAAHLRCNLNLKSARQLTVIMHNFSGFDSKLVLEGKSKSRNYKHKHTRKVK